MERTAEVRKARPAARQGTDYDLNGNLTVEQDAPIGSLGDTSMLTPIPTQKVGDDVYKDGYGWALSNPDKKKGAVVRSNVYQRTFIWDERNMIKQSSDSAHTVKYRYGADGQRTNKYSVTNDKGESIYFNKLWTWRWDSYTPSAGNYCKNIFLDKTRIVTKVRAADETASSDAHREYFYHGDHLQSATLITDYEGAVYERINYTPYGELWLEKSDNNGENYLPYRFTGKELDSETGLYYYGARYLDPKYSRWLSTDPALADYIPQAPINDEARRNNANLPGMGGVFNHINCDLYHYAGNNPVKYTDPDGNEIDISEDSNQRTILAALQRLTNDNLAVSSSGKVIITSEGTGSKTSGTKLLRYLINETDKTIKISTMDSDGTNNSITTPYKVNSDSKLDDLFNGRGLNSLILWSLGEPNITEIDSQGHISDKNCPTYITLGHELIHAYHNANGENHGYMDYGVYFNMEEEKFTKFNLELSENTLRGENGLNKRYK